MGQFTTNHTFLLNRRFFMIINSPYGFIKIIDLTNNFICIIFAVETES